MISPSIPDHIIFSHVLSDLQSLKTTKPSEVYHCFILICISLVVYICDKGIRNKTTIKYRLSIWFEWTVKSEQLKITLHTRELGSNCIATDFSDFRIFPTVYCNKLKHSQGFSWQRKEGRGGKKTKTTIVPTIWIFT